MSQRSKPRAVVIGSGPNGLSAAIVLARAGLAVSVLEAAPTLGGAARTAELTLPGFHHDLGSSVYPLGSASPFFRSLPLADFGLRWVHPTAPLAHPLSDGSAVMLRNSVAETADALGTDGPAWRRLFEPLVDRWQDLLSDLLGPVLHLPHSPVLLARFGAYAALPATLLARTLFHTEPAHALFCGLAAHSVRPLDSPLSAAFGLLLGAAGQTGPDRGGWPVAAGGAQSITDALARYLKSLGGNLRTEAHVAQIRRLPDDELHITGPTVDQTADLVLADLSPGALVRIAGADMQSGNRRLLQRFQHGPGSFKVDWALSAPIPWTAGDCAKAATVHVGGTSAEMAASERAPWNGHVSPQPFVLLTQPSLCDPTRAPAGRHTAWAYCHVPNAWPGSALSAIEAQIERFAPGFKDVILARRSWTCQGLQSLNPNLVGGDLSGGAMTALQMVMRPTPRLYQTSIPGLYLCSSSTPPGGGVHGMCGMHAAKQALSDLHLPPS